MALVILVLASIASSEMYQCLATEQTVDLTHTYDNTTLPWPSEKSERFRFTRREKYDSPHYEANSFSIAEHGGTHVDAPRHFKAGGGSVADIPLSKLIGYSVVVNVTAQTDANRDLQINVSEFEKHESKFGNIPQNSIVLLYTGWSKYWPNATLYFGTSSNNTSILHFPGLSPAGARWLINKRTIKAVGIDTGSIDYGQSQDFQAHRILMAQNIPVFENVANLDSVPAKGAIVYALPMKIGEGTGAPLRIIATWDDSVKSSGPNISLSFYVIAASVLLGFLNSWYL